MYQALFRLLSTNHCSRSAQDLELTLYQITHSEWSSSDAYSASAGSNVSQKAPNGSNFKRLPFNFCAASLQPFSHPVCTPEGTIFDVEVISQWLEKHGTN